jgi:hypothetical protein
MNIKNLRVVGLLVIPVFVLGGCMFTGFGMRAYDVSSDPSWWGELHKGEVLSLNQDTLLNGVELTLGATKATPDYDSQSIFHSSITVEMFKSNPGKYWADLHLLPNGTTFRCDKLTRWFADNGNGYTVYGVILTGGFKGRTIPIDPCWGDANKKGSLKLGPSCLVHPVE